MKKRISLFLAFCLIMSLASVIAASAWTDGPKIVKVAATTDDYDYESENAFDNDPEKFWHSQWRDEGEGTSKDEFPQTLIVELDNTYWLDCIGYLSRPDGSRNGSALELEIWVSTTGSVTDFNNDAGWTKVATGTWDEGHWQDFKENWDTNGTVVFSNVNFDAVEAKLVKMKLMDGMGGWACCAALELGFLGVNYKPMDGFVPRSAPGTPAPAPAPEPVVEAAPAPVVEAAPAPAAVVAAAPAPVAVAPQTGNASAILMIVALAGTAIVATKAIQRKK